MVSNKRILASILGLSTICLLFSGTTPARATDAALSASANYTVTIPSFNSIAIDTTDSNFGTITVADLTIGHIEPINKHAIVVGTGVATSTLSYIASNKPAIAGALTTESYTVAFTPGSGGSQTCTMAAGGVLSLSNPAGSDPLKIDVLQTTTGTPGANLGGVALTENDTTPSYTTPNTGTLTFTSNGILGGGALLVAPLDMTLKLDESSLNGSMVSGDRILTVTFSSTTLTADGNPVAP